MADQGTLSTNDEPPPKRVRLSKTDVLKRYSREDIFSRWEAQETYLDFLEAKRADVGKSEEIAGLRESEAKLQQQQQESTRRENVLVMRLATKEQEIQELLPQIHELKNAQAPSAQQLRSALLDPAVNLLFQRLTTELDETKSKLSQAQDDMSAWKFTPDSVTGKKLMAKCRSLITENQELGKQLSQGRIAQLEAELALQKKYSEELKASQDELNEFILQLDEEVEGMQSTIMKLQGQLRDAKQELAQAQQVTRQSSEDVADIEIVCSETDSPRHDVIDGGDQIDSDTMDVDRTSLHADSYSGLHRTKQSTHTASDCTEHAPEPLLTDNADDVGVDGCSEVVVESLVDDDHTSGTTGVKKDSVNASTYTDSGDSPNDAEVPS